RSLRSMLLFLLLLRPPPTSTLFPYTTLFRSVEAAAAQPAVGFREQRAQRAQFGVALPELGAVALGRARDAVAHGEAVLFGHEAFQHVRQHAPVFGMVEVHAGSLQSQDHLRDDVLLDFIRAAEDRQLAVVEILGGRAVGA